MRKIGENERISKARGSENAVWCFSCFVLHLWYLLWHQNQKTGGPYFFSAGTSGNHFGMGLLLSESILENIADVKGKAGYS